MSVLKTSRKYHKWMMLFLGLQFVVWSVTGAYMVFFNIDYIHGDTLVSNPQTKIDPNNIKVTLHTLLSRYPKAKQIEVGLFINQEVYRFTNDDKQGEKTVVSALTGEQLSPINKKNALALAKYLYTGKGKVEQVKLITENPPFELSKRALPAWRINFDDFGSPSLYISSQTGYLVTKRHAFWRLFDWMFSFHVMDYIEEEVDNQLLFWIALLSVFSCVTGLVLMYYRVFKSEENTNEFTHVDSSMSESS